MSTLRNRAIAICATALLATGIAPVPPANTVAQAVGPVIATLPTDNPANWTPNVIDGEVLSIWQVGSRVIIGGTFTQVADSTDNGGTVYNRSKIAAFDAATGLVDVNFDPVLDKDVEVVIPSADGNSIYVGGKFNTVDGVFRRKVARIDLATGDLMTSFDLNGVNSAVRDLRLVGNTLYVAGLFTSVGGQGRAYLASVDATTGALTDDMNPSILGQHNGGLTKVIKMETTPDNSRLMVMGNFTSIDGQAREQVAYFDLTQFPNALSPWNTDFFTASCANAFDTYVRDLDISADGQYAVFTTTGAYRANTSCDTVARLELDNEVGDVDPTWISYTGGDTSYAVEIHDGVAYVGGHMRWFNNPYAGDRHGAGGVTREGMGALDVVTGLPYSWDPGRDRGVGLFDYHVTDQGIWAGSDTDRWNSEFRQKLAFFPWGGGKDVEVAEIGDLPNDIYQLGRLSGTPGAVDASVLYRVNAGGPALPAADDGPDWEGDTSGNASPYLQPGSKIGNAPFNITTPYNDVSVPSTDADRPPTAIWIKERWDQATGDEMQWNFPVAAGTPVEVRLFMGNRCRCTNEQGERIFDVDLDGVNIIDDLDLVAEYGHDTGAMQAFQTVSDGSIDLVFRHVVENPLVNAIEIIQTDVAPGGTFGQEDEITRFTFDGANPPTGVTVLPGDVAWHTARGAFMANDTLYTLHEDGAIVSRTLVGAGVSGGSPIISWSNPIMPEAATMTGIFYDPSVNKLFYTLDGQNQLFERDFLSESEVIDATRRVASGDIGALNPARVRGMFIGQGHLWFADDNTGDLMKMPYAGGVVSGTPVVADTSIDWRSRALFRSSAAQPNIPPIADFTSGCLVDTCDFDASPSSDPDGIIESYDWDFGDGNVGAGILASHAYAVGGIYTVTLTVTDDRGGVDQHSVDINVEGPPNVAPTAVASGSCSALDCSFDGQSSTDSDGTIVSYDWDFGDGNIGNGATAAHTYGAAGTYTVMLTVTDDDGATGSTTLDVDAFESSAAPVFRAAAEVNVNSSSASITVPAAVQAGDQLVYIVSVSRDTDITTPAGWTLFATERDSNLESWVFTRTADATTAGSTVTTSLTQASKTSGLMVAYSNAAAPTDIASSVMGATSFTLTSPSIPVTSTGSAVISYWSDRSGGNTGWTTPPEVDQRGASVGTGGGHVTAVIADSSVAAGTWPGATATTADDGTKGIAWSIVLPPTGGAVTPTASWTTQCSGLSCDFDGSTSFDPDGTIVSYDWDFGDGNIGSGVTATHAYAASGSYTVTLTVTDNEAQTGALAGTVDVADAVVGFREAASSNANTQTPNVVIPASVQDGDQLVLFATANGAVNAVTPAGWTLLGTAEDGSPDVRSWVFTRTADATTAGTTVNVDLDSRRKTSLVVMGYSGAAPITEVFSSIATSSSPDLTTPGATVTTGGSMVVSYWVNKTGGNTGWTVPGTVTQRADSPGTGGGRITAASGDTSVAAGAWPGATATSSVSAGKAIAWTVIVPAP